MLCRQTWSATVRFGLLIPLPSGNTSPSWQSQLYLGLSRPAISGTTDAVAARRILVNGPPHEPVPVPDGKRLWFGFHALGCRALKRWSDDHCRFAGRQCHRKNGQHVCDYVVLLNSCGVVVRAFDCSSDAHRDIPKQRSHKLATAPDGNDWLLVIQQQRRRWPPISERLAAVPAAIQCPAFLRSAHLLLRREGRHLL